MSVRPERATLVLLEEAMVHITKNWLEEDQDEQHNTDDRVSSVELPKLEQISGYARFDFDIPCGFA